MASGLITSFLGEGLAASRPADPDVASAIAFYWSTDTNEMSAWLENAWVEDVFGTGGALLVANNLSDVANAATSRTNLGVGTGDSPQFTAVNIGHASDTTLARSGAGDLTVEGNAIYRAGGTDVAIADGGTGSSTAAGGWANLLQAASASDINTGTDTSKALTADALAGSNLGTATVTILVSDPAGSAITTGDGKAYYRVPSTLNGMNLVAVAAALTTVSSSGIPTVQIANVTQAADMLTTKLTIDASETDSSTAATAAVIDTGNDDVATGDMLRIDIDVAGTGAKGLQVEMQFRLP